MSARRAWFELLSSMRFAISLLTVVALASIIGTVVQQNEPYPNYVIQFGQFWFSIFEAIGLFDVYHSLWFLTLLAFLVSSISLCIYRNAPLMLKEIRAWRDHLDGARLRQFSHVAEIDGGEGGEALQKAEAYFRSQGFRLRITAEGLVGRKGAGRRFGYMFTHAAIIVICIGGLIDGNLPLKVMEMIGMKAPETADVPVSKMPPKARLSPDNLSFRGNVTVPEGQTADFVFLSIGNGFMVQDLPFDIHLKAFHIDYYPTGMPKNFASDVELVDKASGRKEAATIEVNHPLTFDGVTIYQASFGDGGSLVDMKGWNLFSTSDSHFDFKGRISTTQTLANGNERYQVELTDFRRFNVQNVAGEQSPGFFDRMMSVRPKAKEEKVENFGPSVQFRLRDETGSAKEYDNYFQPVTIDKGRYYLSGVRSTPAEPFRYLRLPLDEADSLDDFMLLRGAMLDAAARHKAVEQFAAVALPKANPGDYQAFVGSSDAIFGIFARGGWEAVAGFIEKNVPEDKRGDVVNTYFRVVSSLATNLLGVARAAAGKPALSQPPDERLQRFISDSLNAYTDIQFYGAPVYLQPVGFEQVQASGLQLTRSPGKNFVYLGSLLLVIGVFFMLYVQERRIWLRREEGGRLIFAFAANRKGLDVDEEFGRHKTQLGA